MQNLILIKYIHKIDLNHYEFKCLPSNYKSYICGQKTTLQWIISSWNVFSSSGWSFY